MQNIPWFVFVLIAVMVGVLLLQRRQISVTVAAANTEDKTLGAMARRMGLQVTEGDPNLNLVYFQQPAGDFERSFAAQGSPYGRSVRFVLKDGQERNYRVVVRAVTSNFDCFLEAELQTGVPPFELSLRAPNQFMVPNLEFAERQELVTVPIADPTLEQLFVVRSADPRLVAALTPALRLLSAQHMVHLAGEGQRVWMSFPRMGLPSLSYAPEEFLLALETAACGLEGRPAPAGLGGPTST
jgi:hypothetical protein